MARRPAPRDRPSASALTGRHWSSDVLCYDRPCDARHGAAMTDLFDLDALRRRLAAAPDAAALEPLGLQTVVLGDGALRAPARGRRRPRRRARRGRPRRRAVRPDARSAIARPTCSPASPMRWRRASPCAASRSARPAAPCTPTRRRWPRPPRGCAGAACLVAVGSGTVADIGKAVAAAHGLPYVVVQTADSVNGFADDRSVLLVSGVKRTTPTTWADALVVDTDVLVDGPGRDERLRLRRPDRHLHRARRLVSGRRCSAWTTPTCPRSSRWLASRAGACSRRRRSCRAPTARRSSAGRRHPHAERHLDGRRRHHGALLGHGARRRPSARDGDAAGRRRGRPCTAPRWARAASSPRCSGSASSTSWPTAGWLARAGARRGRGRGRRAGGLPPRRPQRRHGRGVLARLRAQADALGAAPASTSRRAARDWADPRPRLRELLAGPEELVAALRGAGAPVLLLRGAPAGRRGHRALGGGELPPHARPLLGGRHGLLSGHLGRRVRRRPALRGRGAREGRDEPATRPSPARPACPTRIYPGLRLRPRRHRLPGRRPAALRRRDDRRAAAAGSRIVYVTNKPLADRRRLRRQAHPPRRADDARRRGHLGRRPGRLPRSRAPRRDRAARSPSARPSTSCAPPASR